MKNIIAAYTKWGGRPSNLPNFLVLGGNSCNVAWIDVLVQQQRIGTLAKNCTSEYRIWHSRIHIIYVRNNDHACTAWHRQIRAFPRNYNDFNLFFPQFLCRWHCCYWRYMRTFKYSVCCQLLFECAFTYCYTVISFYALMAGVTVMPFKCENITAKE